MVPKHTHEFRDPIHQLIKCNEDERSVIDSRPVQRLRNVHQLATSYLVYPGATHKRFEHSLGVMELAGRVFDVITNPETVHPTIRKLMPEITDTDGLRYWRRVVRMAALCHDVGHLPFSHAAEQELLPEGHERLTVELIRSQEMGEIWHSLTSPIRVADVEKLAVGQKILPEATYSDWEAILSEVIVGDAFGVDRIDYLLRDSLHCGVAYGHFDHHRLIDTLRILPQSDEEDGSKEPQLGIEHGGLHSAEGLLFARYSMFSQVYYHRVRRAYDAHLKDFLREWLGGEKFPMDAAKHLKITDIDVTAAIAVAAEDQSRPGHDPASRLTYRGHFKPLWQRTPSDIQLNERAGDLVEAAALDRFSSDAIRRERGSTPGGTNDFPVLLDDDRIASAYSVSDVLEKIPEATYDYVLIEPTLVEPARSWLDENREQILHEGLP